MAWFYGWLGAVTFVAACSLYANAASDFASWRADRNPELERALDKLDEVLDKLDRMS